MSAVFTCDAARRPRHLSERSIDEIRALLGVPAGVEISAGELFARLVARHRAAAAKARRRLAKAAA